MFPSKTFLCLYNLKIIFTVSISLAQARLVLLLLVPTEAVEQQPDLKPRSGALWVGSVGFPVTQRKPQVQIIFIRHLSWGYMKQVRKQLDWYCYVWLYQWPRRGRLGGAMVSLPGTSVLWGWTPICLVLSACVWGGVSQSMLQFRWGIVLFMHGLLFLLVSLGAVVLSSGPSGRNRLMLVWPAQLHWTGLWVPGAPTMPQHRQPKSSWVCCDTSQTIRAVALDYFQTNTGLWCNIEPCETPKPCCVYPSVFGGRQAVSKLGQVTWSLLTTQAVATSSCGPDMK